MDFVAIDVETANSDMASICQIGFAVYSNGQILKEWSTLLNPEDYFDYWNQDVHGITEDDIKDSPKFPEIYEELKTYLVSNISVCHTHFDRVSINRACFKYNLEPIETRWLDTAMVARRTWEEFAYKGYGLSNICKKLGYSFAHHDALEDAKASGYILLKAIEKENLNLEEWLTRVHKPINPNFSSYNESINKEGNSEGALYGEVMVFTGSLQLPRREAAELAAKIGCVVKNGVTKKTTFLVVGDQDLHRLAGKSKSAKHVKAEKLISEGCPIRVIKESDFIALFNQ